MIHANDNYNRIQDPLGIIPKDMPVFLLQGKDKFAPKLLLLWAMWVRLEGGNPDNAREIEEHAQRMIEYQKDRGSILPDLPEKIRGKYSIRLDEKPDFTYQKYIGGIVASKDENINVSLTESCIIIDDTLRKHNLIVGESYEVDGVYSKKGLSITKIL